MGHVRHSIEIDAPPERVFDLAVDARRWPEWQTTALEVRDVQGPLDQVGKRYRIVGRIAGRAVEGQGEVSRFERPRIFEVKGTAAGGGRLISRSTFDAEGAGTRATIEIDYELPGGLLGQMASRLFAERQIERELIHSAENLKALIEEGGAGGGAPGNGGAPDGESEAGGR